MKRTTTVWLTVAAVAIGGIVIVFGHQVLNRSDLVSQLGSQNWQERATAVQKLATDADSLKSTEVRSALVGLLDRENQLIESTLRESKGRAGVSTKYGEGYSEYYSTLLDVVDRIADVTDSRTLSILARSAYNPDSPFALKVASYGEPIVATLIELTNSDLSTDRGKALAILGEVLKRQHFRSDHIPASMVEQVKQLLEKGAADADPYVRIQAVRSLGKARDENAIPILERIAQSDPSATSSAEPGEKRYPVREEAVKALAAIKLRPPDEQK
jgi:hypothetical protein